MMKPCWRNCRQPKAAIIVFDPGLVDIDIKGYADLFHPSLKDSVGIIANYRVINGLALKVLGESYNTEDISKIEAAGEKLLELAPNIRVIKDDNLQERPAVRGNFSCCNVHFTGHNG